jgi:hypothetical protein
MTATDSTPLHFEEEERLPWLEPIDDEGESTGRLVGLVLAGLAAIGLLVGGLWWWQNNGGRARGELIAAPEGDYKGAPPREAGRFDGDGNVAVAAAEGVRPVGTVDPNQLPEQPVPPAVASGANRPAASGSAATPPRTASVPVRPAARPAATPPAAAPATAPATGGGMVQLGAFASEATAARAFDSLKARFSWLAPVNRTIVAAQVNGRTVYRLQAAAGSASAAQTLCNRLRVAGENCILVR